MLLNAGFTSNKSKAPIVPEVVKEFKNENERMDNQQELSR